MQQFRRKRIIVVGWRGTTTSTNMRAFTLDSTRRHKVLWQKEVDMVDKVDKVDEVDEEDNDFGQLCSTFEEKLHLTLRLFQTQQLCKIGQCQQRNKRSALTRCRQSWITMQTPSEEPRTSNNGPARARDFYWIQRTGRLLSIAGYSHPE